MEHTNTDKISQIITTRKTAHTYFLKKSKVYQSFLAMEQTTYKDGKLSKLQKELIAVGISVVINCESCMEWHIQQAVEGGATEEEVLEAVDVGMEMGGGPATASARFAMNVLEYYQQKYRK
jgi:AhpD family alkylhydroperoxidase